MSALFQRLVLGTAQLGQHYGIANRIGMPSKTEAVEIVRAAWDCGIHSYDTAHAYGQSEEVLGLSIAEAGIADKVKVISKFPINQSINSSALCESVHSALSIIGIPCLEAMLFHRDNIIESWDRISDTIEGIRSEGLVRYFGISTYDPERALLALGCYGLDAVQITGNLLDRKFDSAGFMNAAVARGVKVYMRSVFLQGLLLMNLEKLPDGMSFAADDVSRIGMIATEYGMGRDELALCYARDRWPQVSILVGAETPEQVRRNVMLWKRQPLESKILAAIEERVGSVDERVIRPDRW